MDPQLGVKTPRQSKLFAILNPSTIKSKNRKVKCTSDVIKNWPMGHGHYRIAGNFGPLIPVIHDARQNGFDDVLWMIDDYVKEMTVLNVFFLMQSRHGEVELITPSDDGCIFNGVNRQSIIELSDRIYKEKNVKLKE
jgi:branched-chain amino acid aminotransferase